jgi:hypothetical protein
MVEVWIWFTFCYTFDIPIETIQRLDRTWTEAVCDDDAIYGRNEPRIAPPSRLKSRIGAAFKHSANSGVRAQMTSPAAACRLSLTLDLQSAISVIHLVQSLKHPPRATIATYPIDGRSSAPSNAQF